MSSPESVTGKRKPFTSLDCFDESDEEDFVHMKGSSDSSISSSEFAEMDMANNSESNAGSLNNDVAQSESPPEVKSVSNSPPFQTSYSRAGLLKREYLTISCFTKSSPIGVIKGVDNGDIEILNSCDIFSLGALAAFKSHPSFAFCADLIGFSKINEFIEKAEIILSFIMPFQKDFLSCMEDINVGDRESQAAVDRSNNTKDMWKRQEEGIKPLYKPIDFTGFFTNSVYSNNDADQADDDDNDDNDNEATNDSAPVTIENIKEDPESKSEWYLKENFRGQEISPDSPIDVLCGYSDRFTSIFLSYSIRTVRHLILTWNDMEASGEFAEVYRQAQALAKRYDEIQAGKQKSMEEDCWGYHYVSEAVYQQILEEKTLKSAYVLFNEYMSCDTSQRPFHAWKRIHHLYVRDTARWMNRKNVDLNQITDADVFAFLVWRSVSSFGSFDCTAGPKAIYFAWTTMPNLKWSDSQVIDQIIAEDTREPFLADRYARVIKINLSKLCRMNNAKIFAANFSTTNPEVVDTNNWKPIQFDEIWRLKATTAGEMYKHFTPGDSFFNKVPHGCIVLNSGSISMDCLSTSFDHALAI